MDMGMIRAVLAVMNADANTPDGHEWFAEIAPVPLWSTEKGLTRRLQFWLLSDAYVREQADAVKGLISQ